MTSLLSSAVRAGVRSLLNLAPTRLWRAWFPKGEVGVCYHMVSGTPAPHVKHYRFLDPAAFEADLDYLQKTFGLISYGELEQRRAAPHAARDNRAILTFDDGFAQCATVVAPILQRRSLDAVFFIITDLIDNAVLFREAKAALCIERILSLQTPDALALSAPLGLQLEPVPSSSPFDMPSALEVAELAGTDARLRPLLHWLLTLTPADEALLDRLCAQLDIEPGGYLKTTQPYMSAEQIRALHAQGLTIGAHSRSHRYLQDLPRAEAEREIVESCLLICGLTGQTSAPFAFPYSGRGLDRAWLGELRRTHPCIGLYFDTGGVIEDEPFVVQRVFGERFGRERGLDAAIRRAWASPSAWRRRSVSA